MVVVYVVELIIPSHPYYEMTAECLQDRSFFSREVHVDNYSRPARRIGE